MQGGKMMQRGLCDIRPEEIEILKHPDGSGERGSAQWV